MELELIPLPNRSKKRSDLQSERVTQSRKQHINIHRNCLSQETVVIKSEEGHPRVKNERDVLKRLQHRTPFLRPLIDEIEEPSPRTTVALKYLHSDLLIETRRKLLNQKEIKYACRRVLEALKVLQLISRLANG